jgi:hypothetical protein
MPKPMKAPSVLKASQYYYARQSTQPEHLISNIQIFISIAKKSSSGTLKQSKPDATSVKASKDTKPVWQSVTNATRIGEILTNGYVYSHNLILNTSRMTHLTTPGIDSYASYCNICKTEDAIGWYAQQPSRRWEIHRALQLGKLRGKKITNRIPRRRWERRH